MTAPVLSQSADLVAAGYQPAEGEHTDDLVLYLEDDADDEPTIWLHVDDEPDRPLPLLRRIDVGAVWPGTSEDRANKVYAAADVLWQRITAGLPTTPPDTTGGTRG